MRVTRCKSDERALVRGYRGSGDTWEDKHGLTLNAGGADEDGGGG
jgi:hypothetical protein